MNVGRWALLLAAALSVACAGAPPPPTSKIEEAAIFGSQLNLCVQTATSRVQADTCRAGVEKFWCGPGGELSSSSGCEGYGKDGGR